MVKVRGINILFMFLFFIWGSIQMTILGGFDGAGRIITLIALTAFIFNLYYNTNYLKTITSNRSVKLWLYWCLYAIFNTALLYDESTQEIPMIVFIAKTLIVPFFILSLVASFKEKDIEYFFKYMEIILFFANIILFIGSDFIGGIIKNELLNVNEMVLITNALIATILLNSIIKKRNTSKVITLLAFPTIFILISGSRMGFGAFLILFLGFWFRNSNKSSILFIFKFLILIFLSFFLVNMILQNTILGERLLSTTEQMQNHKTGKMALAQGTIFENFGDRGWYYVSGWLIFKQNPIFGIGLLNFSKTNPFSLHVEYMIHLVELGIVGFTFYISFLYSLIRGIYIKIKSKLSRIGASYLFFILLSIMFSASVLFLYNSYSIAYLYGVIILLSKSLSYKLN